MAEVTLLEHRATLSCDNCSTEQVHTLALIWDSTTSELRVEAKCKCDVAGVAYAETKEVLLAEEA